MHYDFNILEKKAAEYIKSERYLDAIKIYLFMADGDPSLDGGYLAGKIGNCYENLEDFHAAKYWYGRAVEENPQVRSDYIAARERLKNVTIDDLVEDKNGIVPI